MIDGEHFSFQWFWRLNNCINRRTFVEKRVLSCWLLPKIAGELPALNNSFSSITSTAIRKNLSPFRSTATKFTIWRLLLRVFFQGIIGIVSSCNWVNFLGTFNSFAFLFRSKNHVTVVSLN